MGDHTSPTRRLSRRGLVFGGVGVATAAALAACTQVPGGSPRLGGAGGADGTPSTRVPAPTHSVAPTTAAGPTGTPSASPAVPGVRIAGDGVTDDAPALQRLLDVAAARRAVVDLPSGARLRLRSSIAIPSNTRLRGNGATLINAVPGDEGHLLVIRGVHDVSIDGLTLDGAKDAYRRRTEQRHNILVSRARRVTIDTVHSSRAKGDGLYVGGTAAELCTGISVSRSTFEANHRQGMSLTCVSGMTVTSCRFIGTRGTAPETGVDIEPNADDSVIEDVAFFECEFSGNAGGGVQVFLRERPTRTQQAGTFVDCTFADNPESNGIALYQSRGARIVGGRVEGNGFDGIVVGTAVNARTSAADTRIQNVTIARNAASGIRAAGSFDGLDISGCLIQGNGTSAPRFFAVDADLPGGLTGVDLGLRANAFSAGYGGVRTSRECSHVTLIGNSYSGVRIPRRLLDAAATRSDLDR